MSKRRLPCIIVDCNSSHLERPNGLCLRHNQMTSEYRAKQRAKNSTPEGKEKYKKYSSKYLSKNSVKEHRSAWQKSPEQRYRILCTRAKRKNQIIDLTLEQHTSLTSKFCVYCGGFSLGENYVGIDRVDSSLGYTVSNSVPCCAECNYMKAETPVKDWLLQVIKITAFQQKVQHVEGSRISEERWHAGTASGTAWY